MRSTEETAQRSHLKRGWRSNPGLDAWFYTPYKPSIMPPILSPPVVFVHVPKTAGSAVSHYLRRHCSSAREIAPVFVGDYSIYAQPDRWSVIAGHFTFSRMSGLVPHGRFITFLRDPVARAVSQFKSWHDPAKMTPEWWTIMTADERKLFEWIYDASFEEFVTSDHPAIRKALSNPMTAFLSSSGMGDDVESALTNLRNRFAFFGIRERFAESIGLLRSAFPWLGPYQLPRSAENHSRIVVGEITPATHSRLVSLNDADLALYEAATSLFAERMHATKTSLRCAA